MLIDELTKYTQLLTYIVAIVSCVGGLTGMVVSIRTYRDGKEKERLRQEYGTYDELDNKYVEFMYTCAALPRLDLLSVPLQGERDLTHEELRMERALFAVLISIFERVFVMFTNRLDKNDCKEVYKTQYNGWIDCMRSYCTRPSFRAEWNLIGSQFDKRFYNMMNEIIDDQERGFQSSLSQS